MERVTGIGGIFFKAKNPARLAAWYKKHLGLTFENETVAVFHWKKGSSKANPGSTVWSVMEKNTKYFAPSKSPFMVNYRVANLKKLIALLKKEGVKIDKNIEESEFGKFGWVMDPEGNRIELWEPPKGW